ncbi:MAG: hypothetical protein HQM12_20300 [SAR324 cluster bacterium]|nr:hypothetical protein [SAR324 cluster bacterium]
MKKKWLLSACLIFIYSVILGQDASLCWTPEKEYHKTMGITSQAWITHSDTPAFSCYKSSPKQLNTLQMGERYGIVKNHFDFLEGDYSWNLLVRIREPFDANEIVGWVQEKYLLTRNNSLKSGKTNISEKVLIKEGDAENGKTLQLHGDPELKNKKGGIEVRTVFYVYDFYPRSPTGAQASTTTSVLINPNMEMSTDGDYDEYLIGWVDVNKLKFWNSQIAVEFQPGNRISMMDKPLNENNRNIVFTPRVESPVAYNELRDPVLASDDNNLLIGSFAKLQPDELIQRDTLRQLKTGLEILFILDGTRSMQSAFTDTLKGVEEIAKYLLENATSRNLDHPLFGLVFYRDIATHTPQRYFNGKLIEANTKDCKTEVLLKELGDLEGFTDALQKQFACDGDMTFLESVYKGLYDGINKAKYRNGEGGLPLGTRIVIHIGDAGDHGNSINAQKVAKLMENNNIDKYIAIDVSKSDKGNSFQNTVQDIMTNMESSKTLLIKRPENLAGEINKVLKSVQDFTNEVKTHIEIRSTGFAGVNEGKKGAVSPEIVEKAKAIIAANNFNLNNVDFFRHYLEGYIPADSAVKLKVLVVKQELRNMTQLINSMISNSHLVQQRRDAWNSIMKNLLGEEACQKNGKDIPLSDCNRMRNGIPIRSGFMKYTLSEFMNLPDTEVKKVVCDARILVDRINYIIEEKRPVSLKWKDESACSYEIIVTEDLNEDGFIIKNGLVTKETSPGRYTFIRTSEPRDNEDHYFYREAREEIGWIPIEHFDIRDSRNQ